MNVRLTKWSAARWRCLLRRWISAGCALLLSGAANAQTFANRWDFDSSAGLTFDSEKIEVASGVARLRPHLLATGMALQLNVQGSQQRAEISDELQSGLELANDDFLFAAWVNVTNINSTHAVFQKTGLVDGQHVGVFFQLETQPEGLRLRAGFEMPGRARDFPTPVLIRHPGWVQVGLAVNRRSSTLQYYLNGLPVGVAIDISPVSASLANPGPFRLGADDSLGALVGGIDEVHFWRFSGGMPGNVDAIVRSHYENTISTTPDLVSAWHFEGNGADSIGSNNLALINLPGFTGAGIYKLADDSPTLEGACVARAGASLYSIEHDVHASIGPSEIRYQISGDGNEWWYFQPQSGWTLASSVDAGQSSLMYQIRENLPDAPISTGMFCFRAFFVSDGFQNIGLDRLEVLPRPGQIALVALPAAGRPSPGGLHVIFETDHPAEAYIEYRAVAAPWSATAVVSGGTVFGIDLTGLDPGARYEYRVRFRPRGSAADFAASAINSIPVAPAQGAPAPVTFAVWGDSRPDNSEPLQPQVFYRLMEKIAGSDALFHIAVGDNVNLSGAQPFSEEDAISIYRGWRDPYGIIAGSGYMFFALGNHDEQFLEPGRSYAANARLRTTVQPVNGDALQRYYSWRWGEALFVVMNGSAQRPSPPEIDWVLQQVSQPARWKFVFNHYPLFNSSSGMNASARDQLHAGFVGAGVNIVFQAHDHWYADTTVDGIHYTTSGGAGSPFHPEEAAFHPITEQNHYLRVELSHDSAMVNAIKINEDGTPGPTLSRYCVSASDAPSTDTDGDGESDVCDADDDADGIPDAQDNCRLSVNDDQRDSNGDGYGNRCDVDLNNDGATNLLDLGLFKQAFGTGDADADVDGDGSVNLLDLGLFKAMFGMAPGPSGL